MMQTLDRGKSRDMTYGRGARHWREYRRTSELKYGIYINFVSMYARVFPYTI